MKTAARCKRGGGVSSCKIPATSRASRWALSGTSSSSLRSSLLSESETAPCHWGWKPSEVP
jgi:hypothetical protein